MTNTTSATLRDLCLSHFQILRIPITPNDLDAILERADKQTLSHLKFLDLLLCQQAAARRDRAVERRINNPASRSFAPSARHRVSSMTLCCIGWPAPCL